MKLFRTLVYTSLAMSAVILASCKEDESNIAKAVITDQTALSFAGQNAASQTVTVYSDGVWTADAPDWITVTPSTGENTLPVTVSVADNILSGALDAPRQDTIVVHGTKLSSYYYIIVSQAGDKYRYVTETTVTEAAAVSNGSYLSIPSSQVAAINTNAYIITDGTTNMYVSGTGVEIGDNLNFKATKSEFNGMPAATDIENLTIGDNTAVTYPTAYDLTSSIDLYSSKTIDYVTVYGELGTAGSNYTVTVKDANVPALILAPSADFGLDVLPGHNVQVEGFAVGTSSDGVNIIATSVADKGINSVIYFQDDFEWLEPYSVATDADDRVSIDVSAATGSINIYTNAILTGTTIEGMSLLDNLHQRGYEDLNASQQVIYLQRNYFKFGATSKQSGFILPSLQNTYGQAVNATMSFDWCVFYGGTGKVDTCPITVTISGPGKIVGGDTDQTKDFYTEEKGAESGDYVPHMVWKNESFQLEGVTAETKIQIAPKYINDNTTSKYQRWFLDNIKIQAAAEEEDPDAAKLPVEWTIGVDNINFTSTWPVANGVAPENGKQGYLASTTGDGTIWYNNESGRAADTAKKTKLDVNANCPRVYGAWPGDYCEFVVNGNVAAGKKVKISFETRTSATNPKYWELQYLDGSDWKTAGTLKTATVDGATVEYTHEMAGDGSTNIQVSETVKYANATSGIKFRFVCKTALQANGEKTLAAPNGGTWRLAVTDTSSTEWQPRIQYAN